MNGVAAHLYQQTLKDVLERWHERLGKRFALFVRNGVAAHMAGPRYWRTLTDWCRRLGNDWDRGPADQAGVLSATCALE